MKLLITILLAGLAAPAVAENTLTDRDREILAAQQRIQQERRARAQARCIEQRGVDCNTEQGLQEWLMLEQTREETLLQRYGIVAPPAGAGTSAAPPAPPAGGVSR